MADTTPPDFAALADECESWSWSPSAQLDVRVALKRASAALRQAHEMREALRTLRAAGWNVVSGARHAPGCTKLAASGACSCGYDAAIAAWTSASPSAARLLGENVPAADDEE